VMENFKGYLMVFADSDIFGWLAIICLVVALLGLFKNARKRKAHKTMMYLCVLIVPVIHIAGTYYLNTSVP